MLEVSISELIDRLSIINIKLYNLVSCVEDATKSDKEVAKSARLIQQLNRQRSNIKNSIEQYFGNKDQEVKI